MTNIGHYFELPSRDCNTAIICRTAGRIVCNSDALSEVQVAFQTRIFLRSIYLDFCFLKLMRIHVKQFALRTIEILQIPI